MRKMKSILLVLLIAVTHAQLDMTSDKKMEYEDNVAEESQSSEQRVFTDVLAPKPILNDGKPFYVARDPNTGTLDFNSKKTVGIQNDIPISRKDELSVVDTGASKGHDINSIGHTFHDYLNIPVKYSSSKFVYPLISSSYANLKYQGNNKNQVSNHKNYTSTLGTTTNSPKYFTHIITSKSATEVTTQPPPITTRRVFTTTRTTTEKTTEKLTTRTTTQSPTTTTTTTTQRPTQPPTEPSSTVKYSSTIIQSSQFPSTFKKYIDSSETRKKFTSTTPKPTETTLPANPVKFLDDLLEAIDRRETTTEEPTPTTHRPSHILSFMTSMPLRPSGFKPMPTEAPRNHSQKITFEKAPTDPGAMSLSEIFNSIAGNDNFSNERNEVAYETADSSHVEVKKPLPLSTIAALNTPAPTQAPPPPSPPAPVTPVQHKTLQQQMKNPQYVDLPVHQPPSPAQHPAQFGSSHIGFPDDQFDDYVEFENPQDQYVRYEVQKPNVNMVKFQQMPLPSINNVVISPGQSSASFVLGSQQSVGSIGVGSSMGVGTSHFVDNSNGPVKMGQVINDEPPVRPQIQGNSNNNNPIQASIRFPSDADSAFDNAPIIKGTFKIDGNADSVHPPQALLQNLPAASQISHVTQKPLVFPQNHNGHVMQAELSVGMPAPSHNQQQQQQHQQQPSNPSQVIFENVNEIYEKVNDKKQKKQEVKEVNSNALTPPSVLTPPNPIQLNQFHRQQPQYGPQRRPQKPNILPQFRPNSRLSQGHPLFRQEVGAIRVQNPQFKQFPPQALPKVGLPPMNPNMRRIPPPPPPQYRPQYTESANRRVFKVPPPSSQQFPIADRFMKPPPMQQPPPYYYLNRPVTSSAPETMQMQQRPSIVPYQDVELNKSYPPTPSINITSRNDEDGSGKLEPVVTLQMLQAKKNGNSRFNIPTAAVPHEIPQDLSQLPKNHKNDGSVQPPTGKEPSVYVVYPVSGNGQSDEQQKEQQQQQQIVPSNNEYQNTPFTVVSHFEQEPLLMKKDKKKPQGFPYQIEKPAPPLVEKIPLNFNSPHGHSIYNIGEEPHDPISSKLTRITEKPIAIAYTPTEPSRISPPMSYYQHYQPQHLYSSPNFASPVISEIINDDNHHHHPNGYEFDYYHRQQQQQQHQVHSTYGSGEEISEFHKQNHYDFEAPFHASVSLNPEVTNPYQGWSIVTKPTETNNKIDRSDLNVEESVEDSSTRKYDPEEFQPVFESGFQPIYSSNRVSTAPELLLHSNEESHELPSTLALAQTSPVTHAPSTTTTEMPKIASNEVKSSEESTTEKSKVESKKPAPQSMEIDSLEALFESLTRDYDDEEEASSSNKSENESRSL